MWGRIDELAHTVTTGPTLWIVLAVYALIWFGGNVSFKYTHTCVRSHQEEILVGKNGETQTLSYCDFYTANGKRWTTLDPFRALPGYFGLQR